jgi:hypothetical protein
MWATFFRDQLEEIFFGTVRNLWLGGRITLGGSYSIDRSTNLITGDITAQQTVP